MTEAGLAQIDEEITDAAARAGESGRVRIVCASRRFRATSRYWSARRESAAELSVPEPDGDVVRFGMTVTIEDDGRQAQSVEDSRRG